MKNIYHGWEIDYNNYTYNVDCDDYLHSFNTEDEAEQFIDNLLKEGE